MKEFSLRSGKRTGYVLLSLPFNIVMMTPTSAIMQGKKTKALHPYRKEIWKTIQFADDVILELENSKESTKKNYLS